jgi:hypothetical protein
MEKQDEAGDTQDIGWNVVAMSQEDNEKAVELWRELGMGRAYLGVESTGDDIESKAEWCQDTLGLVVDATTKKIWFCDRSKRWWNGEIKERRSHLGSEKRRRRTLAATAQAQAEFQKLIQRSKDMM